MRHETEVLEVLGRIVHRTNDAILFLPQTWQDGDEVWLPQSQCPEVHREFATTGWDRLVVTAWIAKKKGIL